MPTHSSAVDGAVTVTLGKSPFPTAETLCEKLLQMTPGERLFRLPTIPAAFISFLRPSFQNIISYSFYQLTGC